MIGLSPSTPPPPPAGQNLPSWKQSFVLLRGGVALFASACFGCAFTFQGDRQHTTLQGGLSLLLGALAFAGLVAAISAVVLLLTRIILRGFRLDDEA